MGESDVISKTTTTSRGQNGGHAKSMFCRHLYVEKPDFNEQNTTQFIAAMPWFFPWSDFIKKRACRYLLQHYLGHFLQEKLTLDQLTVDLYNGTGRVDKVPLDVWVSSDKAWRKRIAKSWLCTLFFFFSREKNISTLSLRFPWGFFFFEHLKFELFTFFPSSVVTL